MLNLIDQSYNDLFINATAQHKLNVVTGVRLCVTRGGFGQHLRWLILLSENYTDFDTLNCPGFLFHKKYLPLKTQDRVSFILENVYHPSRTFSNWLSHEKFSNIKLHNFMGLCHDTKQLEVLNNKEYFTIMGIATISNAIKHWYKFNPFWLGNVNKISSEDDFINLTNLYNKQILEYVPKINEKVFLYNSSELDSPILSNYLYNNLAHFLQIDNVYEYAKIIHEAWYNLNKQAESNLLNWVSDSCYPEIPWLDHNDEFKKHGTELQFSNIKTKVLELYA